MKRIIKSSLIVILAIMVFITLIIGNVNAEDSQIQIISSGEIENGYQTMQIKVTQSEEIGAIDCILQGDSNIESIEVDPSFNGWTVTYNNNTGKIIAYNPVGTKDGAIIQFKCKLNDVTKDAKVTLSSVELTTISYNTITVNENIQKEILKATPTETATPTPTGVVTPTTTPTQEPTKTPTQVITPSNNSGANITDNKSNQTPSTIQKINTEDTQKTNGSLPKAGVGNILLVISIAVIIALYCYKRYSNLNNIKY